MASIFRIISVSLLCCSCFSLAAQDFDEYKKQRMKEFASYKDKKVREFDEYRGRVNRDFAEYMRQRWIWLNGNEGVSDPKKDIPDVKPVVLPELDEVIVPEDNEISLDEIIPAPLIDPTPIVVAPIPYHPEPEEAELKFDFYGTVCSVRLDPARKVRLNGCREDHVADMWCQLSTTSYDNLLHDCNSIRERLNLCDWAYLQLAGEVADVVYGAGTNEAVVLEAYIMNQSGFKVRMGRSAGNRLHMLIATVDDMYNRSYWIMDGTHYYLSRNEDIDGLYVFDTSFPNEQLLRLSVLSEQRMKQDMASARHLCSEAYPAMNVRTSANINMMHFYENYPASFRRNNSFSQWCHYANAPISQSVKNEIYPTIRACIAGKTQQEAANILINFVQTALEYKTDDEVWGTERSFFPEESLYYPYCDCEDRSILFSRLVRDLMGLDVVLLYYPGHLATAVCFSEQISGDYIVVNNRRYLVCDPTYINAPIGWTMPGMDNSTVKVVCL